MTKTSGHGQGTFGRSGQSDRSFGLEDPPEQAVVEALTRIDAPVFAVNPGFKPSDEASFVRHGVDLRIVPGVGHFVMLEDPESLNTELNHILNRLDQPATPRRT